MQAMEFHHVRVRPTEQIGSHEHPTWEISYVIRARPAADGQRAGGVQGWRGGHGDTQPIPPMDF